MDDFTKLRRVWIVVGHRFLSIGMQMARPTSVSSAVSSVVNVRGARLAMPRAPTASVPWNDRHDDRAFHAGGFGAGARVAAGIGLQVADADRLFALDREAGHAFADGDELHGFKHGLGNAGARGFEVQDAVGFEQVDRAGVGAEVRDRQAQDFVEVAGARGGVRICSRNVICGGSDFRTETGRSCRRRRNRDRHRHPDRPPESACRRRCASCSR